jgi:regulator of protease activity HflC (stomatin/prohibitin superfamily)
MLFAAAAVDPIDAILAGLTVLGGLAAVVLVPFLLRGFLVVQPRTQVVVLRFGKYVATLTSEGIHYVFPIGVEFRRITSSVISIDLPKMTVLEANGSPIEVSGICSYRIVEAHRALLDIADVGTYVGVLATAVLKNVCADYPYEAPDPHVPCLRKESEVISQHLVHELQTLATPAGVQVLQLRINDLAYAPEIAQSMLLRQQAASLVTARRTIVEGATETVKSAARSMAENGFDLRNEVAESFIANMMLVLTSGERVQTVMPLMSGSEKG